MNPYRTLNCAELKKGMVGRRIRLAGWIDTIRDHGGVIFLDVRDHYGVAQVVLNEEATRTVLKHLSRETVITAEGLLKERDPETVNKKIASGEVELAASSVEVLGKAYYPVPFAITDSLATREEVRLRYRYLDLRNPAVHSVIELRAKVLSYIRNKMESLGFLEVQTPMLTASSPEGARDYLVPSRKFRGKFYALPQAPQIFKQLLMVSGFDKYYQIAPCFRDEDARADRSPGEFYQLDFEMAFATQEDVFEAAEEILYGLFKTFASGEVSPAPFPRITFRDSMLKYGTDKPDLRNPLLIQDLSDFFKNVEFAPFKGKPVRGITADCKSQPKSFFEKMLAFALGIGMKGLGYITAAEGLELKGPIAKFLDPDKKEELIKLSGLEIGKTLFFVSDAPALVDKLAGQIRTELGNRLGLIDESRFELCFITDFPMYEANEDTGKPQFTHNPFSMPQGGMAALEGDPLEILAYQYDIVANGVELSSGAVRNHQPDVMVKAFEIAGYDKKDLEEKFGALFEAFHYGAPPHAGMAPGIDRILMLLAGASNIREVVAFPLSSNGQDLMMNAPAPVTELQLREAHVKIR
ncbi:MAG: aspartate--tRNA ligase [Clostridiales bacterium]|nr:aspartate--tRNA ligase [Clostridiales bacterium]